MPDAVNAPAHYQAGGIEAIDYIAAKLGPDGFRAYCLGNVMKYVSRWQSKDGEQDLRKALVYMGWAVSGKPDRQEQAQGLAEFMAARSLQQDEE